MVRVLGSAAPLVLGLLLIPAIALGIGDGEPVRVAEGPSEVERPAAVEGRPPPRLHFGGLLMFGDPTRSVMSAEPVLWSESCHLLAIASSTYHHAALYLSEGPTNGKVEDLDLYVWNPAGEMVMSVRTPSQGVGLHHDVSLPQDAAQIAVCLAGGARAAYEMIVD